jgi:hypothetical protein
MLKNVEIVFEGNSYSCELKPDTNDSIACNIYQNGLPNFEGKITLKDIYSQIPAFDEYSMEEIFNVLNDVEKDKFELVNSSNQYKLKIMIQVIKKMKELNIPLEHKSPSNMEILQYLLTRVKTNQNQIEHLENELHNLRELKNKEEEENKGKEINFPDIDISKMRLQRKEDLFGEGKWPGTIQSLESGRIAMRIYEKGVAIIDPESLEIAFMIKEPSKHYIELKKDIIAIIKDNAKKEELILIIKIEEKDYKVLQKIGDSKHNYFYKLAKLWDETLIGLGGEICFFKMENNLYVKDFSIIKKDQFSYIYFVFQITKNEIVYAERKEIIFYDIVNKVEKKVIKCADLGFEQIEQETTFEMISGELLCIVAKSREKYKYCAYLINVNKREKVNEIEIEEGSKKVREIFSMKGKYLITMVGKTLKQYKVEKDNISPINELETSYDNLGLAFLNGEKSGKFISYDNYKILEYY